MDIRVIFIEMNENGDAEWFTCKPNDLPITFEEFNGSSGFREKFPNVLVPVDGNVNEWQRRCIMENVRFLCAYGKK